MCGWRSWWHRRRPPVSTPLSARASWSAERSPVACWSRARPGPVRTHLGSSICGRERGRGCQMRPTRSCPALSYPWATLWRSLGAGASSGAAMAWCRSCGWARLPGGRCWTGLRCRGGGRALAASCRGSCWWRWGGWSAKGTWACRGSGCCGAMAPPRVCAPLPRGSSRSGIVAPGLSPSWLCCPSQTRSSTTERSTQWATASCASAATACRPLMPRARVGRPGGCRRSLAMTAAAPGPSTAAPGLWPSSPEREGDGSHRGLPLSFPTLSSALPLALLSGRPGGDLCS
mmetsp:Transcript_126340/g.369137  ORF Transcript_126340/g.369137 Transcript_126340/m.369137 type:complete len:288 (+) Transcript_126340:610-1473(+)